MKKVIFILAMMFSICYGQLNLRTGAIGTGINSVPVTITNFTGTSFVTPQVGTMLHIVSDTTVNGRVSLDVYNNTSFTGAVFQGRRARGTRASPTAPILDDVLSALGADGYGESSFTGQSVGSVNIRAEGTFTNTSKPTYISFTTTPSGSTTQVERFKITSTGAINIPGLNSVGFVQTDASGNLSTAALTSGNITTALGFTPVTNTRTVNGQALSSDVTVSTITGNAGTATTLQTARNINGNSFNGSADVVTQPDILAYNAGGSPWLAQTLDLPIIFAQTATSLVDNTARFVPVWLPKAATLTGIRVYVRTQGSYTGDQNNKVGLYSYSGGTLTLVASSTNSATLWTSAANAFQTIAFSSTYAASAGLYWVCLLYNNSAQTTAPALAGGAAFNNVAMVTYQGTNSVKYFGTLAAQNDLPATQAMSGVTGVTASYWVALY